MVNNRIACFLTCGYTEAGAEYSNAIVHAFQRFSHIGVRPHEIPIKKIKQN